MSTPCKKSGTIIAGDAVCIVGWEAGPPSQPLVARATRANLDTSKTVYGLAESVVGTTVNVLVAGEAAEATVADVDAGVGPATSRIVATNINAVAAADQCRLIRVDRPDGSEHVVGTCDANGHLSVQPRASRDTSAQHVFNVKSYGATSDAA